MTRLAQFKRGLMSDEASLPTVLTGQITMQLRNSLLHSTPSLLTLFITLASI